MNKYISIFFFLFIGNLLSVSPVYAKITNTTITAINKCGYDIFVSLTRHSGHHKHCGKQSHTWEPPHLVIRNKAHIFGPRHVRIGCVYTFSRSKYGDNGIPYTPDFQIFVYKKFTCQ